jgi:hypothetical protein
MIWARDDGGICASCPTPRRRQIVDRSQPALLEDDGAPPHVAKARLTVTKAGTAGDWR